MDETPSDTALLLAVAAGERAAFEAIARRWQPRLLRFAARAVGSIDAADVVQDALVKAFVNAGRYDSKWSPATWLFTLTRHAVVDRLRVKRREHVARPMDEVAERADESVDRRDLHGPLWQIASARLSADQTQALWLHYVEDLDTRAIAKVMGRSWVWVKTALHRGRKTLAPHVRHLHDAGLPVPRRVNEVIA